MKKIMFVICILLLSGCGGITDKGIKEAYKICESRDGVKFIESVYIHPSDHAKVWCNDGSIITYKGK